MKKIFDDAKDKNVANVVFYGDTTDNKLYYEASGETKTQVTQADLEDAFKKGRLIVAVGNNMYAPVKVAANKVTVADIVSNAVALVDYTAKATVAG